MKETIAACRTLLLRDLAAFAGEIRSFPEEGLWEVWGAVHNSAGNLGLHIAGNLRHYVGLGIGQIPYERQRDREFADKGLPKETVLAGLETARQVVSEALEDYSPEQWSAPYPDLSPWQGKTQGEVLLTLLAHLNYHLGQLNYLRRLY